MNTESIKIPGNNYLEDVKKAYLEKMRKDYPRLAGLEHVFVDRLWPAMTERFAKGFDVVGCIIIAKDKAYAYTTVEDSDIREDGDEHILNLIRSITLPDGTKKGDISTSNSAITTLYTWACVLADYPESASAKRFTGVLSYLLRAAVDFAIEERRVQRNPSTVVIVDTTSEDTIEVSFFSAEFKE